MLHFLCNVITCVCNYLCNSPKMCTFLPISLKCLENVVIQVIFAIIFMKFIYNLVIQLFFVKKKLN